MSDRRTLAVICEACGIELRRTPASIKRSKHIFCEDCAKEYNRKRMSDWNKKNNGKAWHIASHLRGKNHPNYKGISKRPDGYLRILVETNNRQLYHRYLMEKKLGRKLLSKEVVHHKDRNPSNNSINNLELFNNRKIDEKLNFRGET